MLLPTPKFRLGATERSALLESYLPYADIVKLPDPPAELPVSCRDRDDLVFLQLALACGAPLVSGDRDLTVLRGVAPVRILSLADLRKT